MKFFYCVCFILTAFTLSAEPMEGLFSTDELVEVVAKNGALIPDSWTVYSTMKPALPSDYVAFSFEEDFDKAENIIWCRKKDIVILKQMDEGSFSKCPCFFVSYIPQAKMDEQEMEHAAESMLNMLHQAGFFDAEVKKVQFGDHIVLSCENVYNGLKTRIACVGINHDHLLQVIYAPSAENKEIEKEYKEIWDTFISQTTNTISEQ